MEILCSNKVKMNEVDCLGCENIYECLQDETKTSGVDNDVLQLLRISVHNSKNDFNCSLKKGDCGLYPFLAPERCKEKRKWKEGRDCKGCWGNEKNISPAFLG